MKAKFKNGYTITVTLRDGNLEYFVQYPDGYPYIKGWTEHREADMYDYEDEIDYILAWCLGDEDELINSGYKIVED